MGNRERYLTEGAAGLGDAELVALVLETGSGGRSAVRIASELLEAAGGVGALARMEPQEWLGIAGIGRARAVRLHAALELGRRAVAEVPRAAAVTSAHDAFALLGPPLRGLREEELHALFLDRRHRPLAHRRLTRGSDAFTVVEPRQVFRLAVATGAAGVILAHNHPSGDPTPSAQDREVTERVARAGKVLGIPLLDHLVVGSGSWVALGDGAPRAGTAWATEVTGAGCSLP